MIINSALRKYEVNIEKDFSFITSLKDEKNAFFVIDKVLYSFYKDTAFKDFADKDIYIFESLESNKTIDQALKICEKLTEKVAKKNIHLISFGGGIVQDVTGFVASVLYRGIKWTFVPTTLLSACDSCIGGKTSLNYKHFKNLLGTFYPPERIFICSRFFDTLSEKDYESGLGEVVKFNIMSGLKGLNKIDSQMNALLERDKLAIDEYMENSLGFKKDFIEADEFDKGIRIHLNFAHTFGHAYESITDYAIPHGTAVALGMLVANRVSLERNMLTSSTVLNIEKIIKQIIHIDNTLLDIPFDKYIAAIRKDKKQVDDNLTAVLLSEDFSLGVYHNLNEKEIKVAVKYVQELFTL